jgi:hypothetical protein
MSAVPSAPIRRNLLATPHQLLTPTSARAEDARQAGAVESIASDRSSITQSSMNGRVGIAKIAKPTGSKLCKVPRNLDKSVRWVEEK